AAGGEREVAVDDPVDRNGVIPLAEVERYRPVVDARAGAEGNRVAESAAGDADRPLGRRAVGEGDVYEGGLQGGVGRGHFTIDRRRAGDGVGLTRAEVDVLRAVGPQVAAQGRRIFRRVADAQGVSPQVAGDGGVAADGQAGGGANADRVVAVASVDGEGAA